MHPDSIAAAAEQGWKERALGAEERAEQLARDLAAIEAAFGSGPVTEPPLAVKVQDTLRTLGEEVSKRMTLELRVKDLGDLAAEAHRWYRADGTFEALGADEVRRRRIEAARELERLHRDLDAAAARMVVLERERDAARANFTQARDTRDRAVSELDQVLRALRGKPPLGALGALAREVTVLRGVVDRVIMREQAAPSALPGAPVALQAEVLADLEAYWLHDRLEAQENRGAREVLRRVREAAGLPPDAGEPSLIEWVRERAAAKPCCGEGCEPSAPPETLPCPLDLPVGMMTTCPNALRGEQVAQTPRDTLVRCNEGPACHATLQVKAPALVRLHLAARGVPGP